MSKQIEQVARLDLPAAQRPRVLIFIVAYNAETTIRSVLSRIPESLREFDTEILIIDDASRDQTFEKALHHTQVADLAFPVTVLFNPKNQGYGGNQKLGFRFAIERNFDIVALVHGDGQYAPEKLPELLAPLVRGEADAVFGSRMITRGGALRGGMPLYKFVGNRILTFIQNWALRTSLSEFHSGYRLYSVSALRRVPFELNSRDFHFDTEIIIQVLFAGQRIKEIPIPTYYGDEVSHVNGMRYAANVVRVTLGARLQSVGLIYIRRFDLSAADATYKPKLAFDSSHSLAIDAVAGHSAVLDIGCAGGYVGRALRQDKGCVVTGVDAMPLEDRSGVDSFHQVDLDRDPLPVQLEGFQYVLLLDVIEHLTRPEAFLARLAAAAKFAPQTRLVVSTGNVGFFIVRLMLLLGAFNYGKRGILDMTHTRLFTFTTLSRLLKEAGFEIERLEGIPAPFPLAVGHGRLGRFLLWMNRKAIWLSRGLFSYQIFAVARPQPSLELLLQSAMEVSATRRENALKRAGG